MMATQRSHTLAKIDPPRIRSTVRRARLIKMLDAAQRVGKTWIHGPPASGKSTLAATYVAGKKRPVIWYSFDVTDNDPTAFFENFQYAVRRALPRQKFRVPAPAAQLGPIELAARHYFRELYQHIAGRFTLVFDDCHEIDPQGPAAQLLRTACEELPATGFALCLSRMPPLPAFSCHIVNRRLERLGGSALRTTATEAREVLTLLTGRAWSLREATKLNAKVDGWMGGLVLECERVSGEGQKATPQMKFGDLLHKYFEHEILRRFTADERRLLNLCAWQQELRKDSIEEITGKTEAVELIEKLACTGFFVIRTDRQGYRLHPLFREVLLLQMSEVLTAPEVEDIATRIAVIAERQGDLDQAAEAYVRAQYWRGLIALITRCAGELLGRSRHATLERWITLLPASTVACDPALLYWWALCTATRQPNRAEHLAARAYEKFRDESQLSGMMLSWAAVADAIFLQYQDLQCLDVWIERFDAEIAPHLTGAETHVAGTVLSSILQALSFRRPGHPWIKDCVVAIGAFLRTEAHHPAAPMILLQVITHLTMHGRLTEAEQYLRTWDSAQGRPRLQPLARVTNALCRAAHALHAGEHLKCLKAVDSGLRVSKQTGVRIWDSVMLCHGASTCMSAGHLAEARSYLLRVERMRSEGLKVNDGYYMAMSLWLEVLAGAGMAAVAKAHEVVQICAREGVPHFEAAALIELALVLEKSGNVAEARIRAEAALRKALAAENSLVSWFAQAVLAYLELRMTGNPPYEAIKSVFRVGEERGFCTFFFWPKWVFSELCAIALERGFSSTHALHLIERHRLEPPVHRLINDVWPYALKIYTFGRFELQRSANRRLFGRKNPKVRLRVLKALIALGGRDVRKDLLAKQVWPSRAAGRLRQLKTELNRLRSELGRSLIEISREKVSLNIKEVWVDAFYLRGLASTSADRSRVETECRRLACGTFLPDESMPIVISERQKLEQSLRTPSRGVVS